MFGSAAGGAQEAGTGYDAEAEAGQRHRNCAENGSLSAVGLLIGPAQHELALGLGLRRPGRAMPLLHSLP
jgi:hypothetical protein